MPFPRFPAIVDDSDCDKAEGVAPGVAILASPVPVGPGRYALHAARLRRLSTRALSCRTSKKWYWKAATLSMLCATVVRNSAFTCNNSEKELM